VSEGNHGDDEHQQESSELVGRPALRLYTARPRDISRARLSRRAVCRPAVRDGAARQRALRGRLSTLERSSGRQARSEPAAGRRRLPQALQFVREGGEARVRRRQTLQLVCAHWTSGGRCAERPASGDQQA